MEEHNHNNMIASHKYKNITWIDLDAPTTEDIKTIMRQHNIPPLVADELLKPTTRPKADVYSNLVYLILHFPVYDISKKASEPGEVDFIIGKNFFITTHYKSIIPLHELIKTFEIGLLLKEDRAVESAGKLMHMVIKTLYNHALRQLDHIHSKINIVEESIFTGQEKEMVKEISYIQRDVLEFQRAIHAHNSVLRSLEEADSKILGADFPHYLKSMIWELARVENLLNNSKETIELLRDTNDSLLSNKTNEIMQKLTSLALITFPMVFVLAMFSTSLKSFPLANFNGAFWLVLFLAVSSAFSAFMLFKKKKLL